MGNKWWNGYTTDYNIERPDRDYPDYEDYFKDGDEEEVFDEDDLDEF